MIPTLSEALAERGYETLTPVQEAVTDPGLDGKDLLVSAQTGSGKTVAFGLAIAPTLLSASGTFEPAEAPLALVVAPTRELAIQVMRELGWLYAKAGARVASCVGGMDMRAEKRALEQGPHIVVGTPGRLRDHIQRGSLVLGQIRAVVLDEADEMLDMGFREDLEFMLGEAPADKRTLLFSATVPPQIAKMAQQFQQDAVRVTTTSGARQHADIAYQALRVSQIDAENAIINVLRFHDAATAIVFANTRATVSRLSARFSNRGLSVVTLSGELSQKERTHALQAMRDGRARVCVATDVAARGIDLPNLELVVHAELPTNAEGLLHRSGRTGRAGRKGTSVLIVPPKAGRRAEMLLRNAKIEAEWGLAPSAEEILRRDEEKLLADPAWTEEVTEEQAEFAAKLLALHSPERIAAAFLRLHREKQSAPEDLVSPDAPPPVAPRREFGPSQWFSLSVGRDQRAEPRWLLPLLLRAGRLDKDAIGAIRVQKAETFVQIANGRVPGFLEALGAEGVLEEGVTVRPVDGEPRLGGAPARPVKAGHRKGPRAASEEARAVAGSTEGEAGANPTPREAAPEEERPGSMPKRPRPSEDEGPASGPAEERPRPVAKRARSAEEELPVRKSAKRPAAARPAAPEAKRGADRGTPGRPPKPAPTGRRARTGKARPGEGGTKPPRR
jgi:ATP-dependent RNA helicase DeaD